MFGVTHGLAMGLLTFDWGQITAFNGSPLPTPWWAAAHTAIAVAFFAWFLVPILYVSSVYHIFVLFCDHLPKYTNTWYSGFLPMVASGSFDNTGSPYNVTRILNDDSTFNLDAYKAYSPLFISVTFAISYGLSFAAIASTVTHTLLYYRKQIWNQARRSLSEQPDIHARLMSVYKGVPDWWYLSIFCASIRSRGSECTATNVLRSVHVCVRCRFHRDLEHRVPCLGFRPRSDHLCVSRYPPRV
jgi:hypothetical protein